MLLPFFLVSWFINIKFRVYNFFSYYLFCIILILLFLWIILSFIIIVITIILLIINYSCLIILLKLSGLLLVGLITTSQECHNINESISLHECSIHYLQFNDTSLVFDPEVDNCSTVYQAVQTSFTTVCNGMNNSEICTFDLPEPKMEDQRCFHSNWLSVEYKCEGNILEKIKFNCFNMSKTKRFFLGTLAPIININYTPRESQFC